METLVVDEVTKSYRGGTVANDAVSLSVNAGNIVGLLGPNGAGKTTLVRQVVGLTRPTRGSIRMGGAEISQDPSLARKYCAFQPQGQVALANLTPLEAIVIVGRLRGGDRMTMRARASELLELFEMEEWAHTVCRRLSGGIVRLTTFCMAVVHPASIVILDEPTNDVDPLRRSRLWAELRQVSDNGAAVLLVTHNVIEAERCVDRVVVMDKGKVKANGTLAELQRASEFQYRLRLEIEPNQEIHFPELFVDTFGTARRFYAGVREDDIAEAVRWAVGAKRVGNILDFDLSPVSLEEHYLRTIGNTDDDGA